MADKMNMTPYIPVQLTVPMCPKSSSNGDGHAQYASNVELSWAGVMQIDLVNCRGMTSFKINDSF